MSFILYAPAPGIFFDSFPTSNGALRTDFTVEIPVFFFNLSSASLILYSPTPGFLFPAGPNLSTFCSI